MLTTREAVEEGAGRLTLVELRILVYELGEREDALRDTCRALRRSGRWRDARDVDHKRRGLERERRAAERRIRNAEGRA